MLGTFQCATVTPARVPKSTDTATGGTKGARVPRMTLTTRGIQALKPKAHYVDYWSDNPKERGFGLRVYATGVKSWLLYTRKTKDGNPIMVTLGTFPEMKLAKARREAEQKRADVKKGERPADERRAEREAQRNTVAALFKAYAADADARHQAGEYRSWPDVKRSLERDMLPEWASRPVTEIRRRMC